MLTKSVGTDNNLNKIGMIRYLIPGIFVLLVQMAQAQSFFAKADHFFSRYVSDGRVDYMEIRKQPQLLNELVADIAELDLTNRRVTPGYLKAFYINAYNILVIKQVVERYPIEGPLRVDGFFNRIKHRVMGEEMTLDELEKGILYKQFPDPRLHFVLVCAARGCPPLVSHSYLPEALDQQLTSRTREVLNLDWFIRVNNKNAEISQIFSWYQDDFVQSAGSVIDFINLYREKKLSNRLTIDHYEYDWSLNGKDI